MHDLLGPGTITGYCTNVHAGTGYAPLLANLERYALAVKAQVSPDQPMGVGLWLDADTARQMIKEHRTTELARWLQQRGLIAFTFNGFPYGKFHSPVVKHRVYQPDWRDPRRLAYTLDLITILAGLLGPDDQEGSISTLPIGWGDTLSSDPTAIEQAVGQLLQIVDRLAQVEQETGKLIHLDLEPEPGCLLQTSTDIVTLFREHLDARGNAQRNRRYLRVCHDICHGAVMFEDQSQALKRYQAAGIRVGKVQISSAVTVRFDRMSPRDQLAGLQQLQQLAEDRYLHQTVIQTTGPHGETSQTFYDDLPAALATCDPGTHVHADHPPTDPWRVHFHVPLFVERFGLLETTNDQIIECLRAVFNGVKTGEQKSPPSRSGLATNVGCNSKESGSRLMRDDHTVRHFEIETYAWDVLPTKLRQDLPLADGIAREWDWLKEHAPSKASV